MLLGEKSQRQPRVSRPWDHLAPVEPVRLSEKTIRFISTIDVETTISDVFFCSASSSTFSRLSRFLKDSLELSFRSSRRWMPRIDRNLDPLPCPEGLKLNRLSSNWLETCQLFVSYRIAAELGTCIGSYAALPTCRSIVHNFVWQVCHENISTFIIKHVKLYLRSMRIRTKLPPTALLTV